jgi:hypothetical protein
MGNNNIALARVINKSIFEESSQQVTHALHFALDFGERMAKGIRDLVIYDPCIHLGNGRSISGKVHL